jgi:hypothetical protein
VDLREVKEERADTMAVDLTTDTLSQTDTTAAKAAKEERVDTITDSKKNAKLFASTTNTTTIHLLCVSGSVVYTYLLFICSATSNHKFLPAVDYGWVRLYRTVHQSVYHVAKESLILYPNTVNNSRINNIMNMLKK